MSIKMLREMELPINSLWDTFQTALEESIQKYIPRKTARTKDGRPWITRDRCRLVRKRDRCTKGIRNWATDRT
jgi:hypothetical protein